MHGLLIRLKTWCRKKPKPLALVIFADILLTAVALVVFALFHHVIPQRYAGIGQISSRPAATPAPTVATAEPTAEPTLAAAEVTASATAIEMPTAEPAVTVDPVGYFGTKFADKFITGEPVTTVDGNTVTYVSENVRIELKSDTYYNSVCYIADIHVRDISNLSTSFAEGEYGKGLRDWAKNIADESGAILAINGDYYGARSSGVVIRNGTLYRDDYSNFDVCVLYWDGTMETYSAKQFDVDEAMARGAYQAWCFGPRLLDSSGAPRSNIKSDVVEHNPRTVIGYYEPGHYCFVVVDGRSDASYGIGLDNLANFMSQLGCKQAYNLDGGQTSVMTWGRKVISVPSDGGRKTSDIVMIVD